MNAQDAFYQELEQAQLTVIAKYFGETVEMIRLIKADGRLRQVFDDFYEVLPDDERETIEQVFARDAKPKHQFAVAYFLRVTPGGKRDLLNHHAAGYLDDHPVYRSLIWLDEDDLGELLYAKN